MNITQFKAYLSEHIATLEGGLQAEFLRFSAFVEAEESKSEAEIAHLESNGYTVAKPA